MKKLPIVPVEGMTFADLERKFETARVQRRQQVVDWATDFGEGRSVDVDRLVELGIGIEEFKPLVATCRVIARLRAASENLGGLMGERDSTASALEAARSRRSHALEQGPGKGIELGVRGREDWFRTLDREHAAAGIAHREAAEAYATASRAARELAPLESAITRYVAVGKLEVPPPPLLRGPMSPLEVGLNAAKARPEIRNPVPISRSMPGFVDSDWV